MLVYTFALLAFSAMADIPKPITDRPLSAEEYVNVERAMKEWRNNAKQAVRDCHWHRSLESNAWALESGAANAGANLIPAEFAGGVPVGTMAGMGNDAAVLAGWMWRCTSTYNGATDVNEMFTELLNAVGTGAWGYAKEEALIQLPYRIRDAILKKVATFRSGAAQSICTQVDKNIGAFHTRVSQIVSERVEGMEGKGTAEAMQKAMAEALVNDETTQAAIKAAELELANAIKEKATAVIAGETTVRGAEAISNEIPIWSTIFGGVAGTVMMRWCCGDVNDSYSSDYIAAIDTIYETTMDQLLVVPGSDHSGLQPTGSN